MSQKNIIFIKKSAAFILIISSKYKYLTEANLTDKKKSY